MVSKSREVESNKRDRSSNNNVSSARLSKSWAKKGRAKLSRVHKNFSVFFETLTEQSIKNFSKVIENQKSVDELINESNEMIETCRHSSIMLLNLINDLLDLAKHEKLTF